MKVSVSSSFPPYVTVVRHRPFPPLVCGGAVVPIPVMVRDSARDGKAERQPGAEAAARFPPHARSGRLATARSPNSPRSRCWLGVHKNIIR